MNFLYNIICLLSGVAMLAAFIFTWIVIKNKFKWRSSSTLIESGIYVDILSFCTKKGGAIALIIVIATGMLSMFFMKPEIYGVNSLYLSRSGNYYYYVKIDSMGSYFPAKIHKTDENIIYLQEIYFADGKILAQFYDEYDLATLTINKEEIVYDVDDVWWDCTLTNDHAGYFTTEDDTSVIWYIVYAFVYITDICAIGCIASIIDNEKFKMND